MQKAIWVLLISILVATSSCFNKNKISVAIAEDQQTLELKASYKPSKTYSVEQFIKSEIEQTEMFTNVGSTNKTTLLNDNTKVYIKSGKGKLYIKLNKQENSEASYHKVKHICEEVKNLITD